MSYPYGLNIVAFQKKKPTYVPREIIMEIFSYCSWKVLASGCSRVNKEWNSLYRMNRFWRPIVRGDLHLELLVKKIQFDEDEDDIASNFNLNYQEYCTWRADLVEKAVGGIVDRKYFHRGLRTRLEQNVTELNSVAKSLERDNNEGFGFSRQRLVFLTQFGQFVAPPKPVDHEKAPKPTETGKNVEGLKKQVEVLTRGNIPMGAEEIDNLFRKHTKLSLPWNEYKEDPLKYFNIARDEVIQQTMYIKNMHAMRYVGTGGIHTHLGKMGYQHLQQNSFGRTTYPGVLYYEPKLIEYAKSLLKDFIFDFLEELQRSKFPDSFLSRELCVKTRQKEVEIRRLEKALQKCYKVEDLHRIYAELIPETGSFKGSFAEPLPTVLRTLADVVVNGGRLPDCEKCGGKGTLIAELCGNGVVTCRSLSCDNSFNCYERGTERIVCDHELVSKYFSLIRSEPNDDEDGEDKERMKMDEPSAPKTITKEAEVLGLPWDHVCSTLPIPYPTGGGIQIENPWEDTEAPHAQPEMKVSEYDVVKAVHSFLPKKMPSFIDTARFPYATDGVKRREEEDSEDIELSDGEVEEELEGEEEPDEFDLEAIDDSEDDLIWSKVKGVHHAGEIKKILAEIVPDEVQREMIMISFHHHVLMEGLEKTANSDKYVRNFMGMKPPILDLQVKMERYLDQKFKKKYQRAYMVGWPVE